MMSQDLLLVSFCNVTIPDAPLLAAVDVWTGDAQVVDVPRVIGTSVGVTGAVFAGDRLYLLSQGVRRIDGSNDGRASLFIVRDGLEVEEHYFFEYAKDPHSLVVDGNSALVVSTGTDEVVELVIQAGRVIAERAVWRASDAEADTCHLNAICRTSMGYVVSGFGQRSGESWATAEDGFVKVLGTEDTVVAGLYQPHSLLEIDGQLAFCESRRGVVRLSGGLSTPPLGAYVRGLARHGDRLFVGVSRGRFRSRSRGVVENPGASGDPLGHCALLSLPLDLTAAVELTDLSHLAQEIYDLAPVPPSFRLPLVDVAAASRAITSSLWASFERVVQRESEQARDLERLRLMVAEREADVAAVAAELAALRAAVAARDAEKTEEAEKLRVEIDRLTALVSEREAEVADAAGELLQLRATLAAREGEAAEKSVRLSAEIDRLTSLVNEREAEVAGAAGEILELRAAIAAREGEAAEEAGRLRVELDRITSVVLEREAQLASIAAELAGVRATATAREAQASDELARAHSELATVAETRDLLDAELRRAAGEVTALRSASARERRMRDRVEHLLADSEQRIAWLARELSAAKQELSEREVAGARAERRASAFEAEVRRVTARVETLESQIAAQTHDNAALTGEVARLSAAIGALEAELVAAQDETTQARAAVETAAETIGRLSADAEQVGTELEAARSELDQMRSQLGDATVEVARLTAEVAAGAEVRASLEASLNLLRALTTRRARRWMAISQFLSWLVPPRRAGYAVLRRYLRLRRSHFDADAYLLRYPDVARAGLSPLMHYAEHGIVEGRSPDAIGVPAAALIPFAATPSRRRRLRAVSQFLSWVVPPRQTGYAVLRRYLRLRRSHFDADAYLLRYPDVARAGLSPLMHYAEHGVAEGRSLEPVGPPIAGGRHALPTPLEGASAPAVDPESSAGERPPVSLPADERQVMAAEFDAAYYAAANPDVVAAGIDPLEHYANVGWREGRNPSASFSTTYYLSANEDVRSSGMNPFLHYLLAGRGEGRAPCAAFAVGGYEEGSLDTVENELIEWLYPASKGRDEPAGLDGNGHALGEGDADIARLVRAWIKRAPAVRTAEQLAYRPLVSVLVPTFNTPPPVLADMVRSILAQSYTRWELIIVDDGSTAESHLALLAELPSWDDRISVTRQPANAGISAASNRALELAGGDFVAFVDHDDLVLPDALLDVVRAINDDPEVDAVYTDQEYAAADGSPQEPLVKPDWDPYLFLGVMYVGHLLVVRRSVAIEIGGFDSRFDNVQDFEFMLRVSEQTTRVVHIPTIHYRWRRVEGSVAARGDAKANIEDLQSSAVSAHLRRRGIPAVARPNPRLAHRAQIVPVSPQAVAFGLALGPAESAAPALTTLRALRARADTTPERVTLWGPGADATAAVLSEQGIAAAAFESLREAAERAHHDVVLFLEPGFTPANDEWLEQLHLFAGCDDVACASGIVIDRAGVVAEAGLVIGLDDGVGAALAGRDADSDGYAGSLSCARSVSAVSGRSVMLARAMLTRVGGMNRHYADARLAWIDFSFRAAERNLRCVVTPSARFIEHEKKHVEVPRLDRLLLHDRWGRRLSAGDPFHNSNFHLEAGGFTL